MNDRIGNTDLARMFSEAAKQIREEHEALSKLDSVAGDGDHGTTMLRVAEQLEAAAGPASSQSLSAMLKDAGWRVLSVDGGASSALFGTFLGGMADAEMGDEMNCGELASCFEAGLGAVSKRTKARPGDKTMVDALLPAVEALRAAASAGKSISQAMTEAAAAASSGAESTRNLAARYGRAKFLGEKTRGYPDAGATSVALLFRGFRSALTRDSLSTG